MNNNNDDMIMINNNYHYISKIIKYNIKLLLSLYKFPNLTKK